MSLKIASIIAATAFVFIGCILFVNADVSHLPLAPSQIQPQQQKQPVTEVCLGCICEAISGCNQTTTCNGEVCGLFKITWAYWADAGKPTLNSESPASERAYPNCVNDPYCAARTVQAYMARFGQDCNGDGIINCYDHAAIHLLGGYGCTGQLKPAYASKLQQCLDYVQQVQG